MKLKRQNLVISFKKYLKSKYGQSVLEYSLLLIVLAAASLAVFWGVGRLKVGDGESNIFRSRVTQLNNRALYSPM